MNRRLGMMWQLGHKPQLPARLLVTALRTLCPSLLVAVAMTFAMTPAVAVPAVPVINNRAALPFRRDVLQVLVLHEHWFYIPLSHSLPLGSFSTQSSSFRQFVPKLEIYICFAPGHLPVSSSRSAVCIR